MLPILGRYGPFFLYSYTLLLATAVLATAALAARHARRHPDRWPKWPDALIAALFGGLVGGRLAYVAVNWPYFAGHLAEIPLLWLGGLGYHGALLGGLIALWLARRRRRPLAYATLFAPGFALGHVCGWLACGLTGCAYGRETTLAPGLAGLLAADLPDLFGVYAVRYPTQWLGAALTTLVFIAVWRIRPPDISTSFWLALLGTTAVRLLLAPLRGDPVPLLFNIRLDLLLDAAILLLTLLAWWANKAAIGKGVIPMSWKAN